MQDHDGKQAGGSEQLPADERSPIVRGDKPADEQGERQRRFYQPQPDAPLAPHYAKGRAQLLGRLPRVLITPDAYRLMSLYIEIADKEVGWLGTAERTAGGDFLIDNVFLLEQEVSRVETELSIDGQEKLAIELIEGRGEEGIALSNRLKFWGHSHVRMQTQPSGTDERTMVRFGEDGHQWYLRGIFNKLGRAEFTIYLYETGIRIIDAPWAVWDRERGIILEGPRGGMRNSYFGGSSADEPLPEGGFGFLAASGGIPQRSAVLDELKPSEALRQRVKTEFAAKVSERKFPFWRTGAHEICPQCNYGAPGGPGYHRCQLQGGSTIVQGEPGTTAHDGAADLSKRRDNAADPANPEALAPGQPPSTPKRRWSFTKWLTEGDGNAT